MLRHSVLLGLLGASAGLNITTREKLLWMEFPELLTVVRHGLQLAWARSRARCANC